MAGPIVVQCEEDEQVFVESIKDGDAMMGKSKSFFSGTLLKPII